MLRSPAAFAFCILCLGMTPLRPAQDKTNKDKEIEKQEEKANDKENTDISNMISDDYLLSNDELSEDDNEYDNEYIKKETTHVDASTLLQNRGATYGMDEAASLVFGKGE